VTINQSSLFFFLFRMQVPILDSVVWWNKVKNMTDKAFKSGALQTLETKSILVQNGGITWIVRLASTLQNKPNALAKTTEAKAFNPFLPPDPELLIDVLPGGTHNLLLNKFNVVPFHLLVTTVNFQSQMDILNINDLRSTWACVKSFNALAFFNCGKESGASQPHKHLQLLPLPIDQAIPDVNFPLEPLLLNSYQGYEENQIFVIRGLPFKHACLRIAQDENDAEKLTSNYLNLYRSLHLDEIDEQTKERKSYNFLMTSHWMLLIPRMKEKYINISVNSVGFAGTILVKSEEDQKTLVEFGPLELLQQLTFPKE